MPLLKRFEKSRWEGNQFPSISIVTDDFSDYDTELFQKIFEFIKEAYANEIDPEAKINTLLDFPVDRYFADFKISDCLVMMDMDGFNFSIGFSKEEWRDKVFTRLTDNIERLI